MLQDYIENFKKSSLVNQFKHFAYDTPVEIFLCAALIGSLGFKLSYDHNYDKESHIPLAFSEIQSIERKAQEEGKNVPSATRYYANLNDTVMRIFEARNEARQRGGNITLAFANELSNKMQGGNSKNHHKSISASLDDVSSGSESTLLDLDRPIQASHSLPTISTELDQSWTEWHHSHYHPEHRTRLSCSGGKRRSCHTVHYTVQVYDYTTHHYGYHPEHGLKAAQDLISLITSNPNLDIGDQILRPSAVGQDNKDAIYRSMPAQFKEKLPTDAEYLTLASTWANSANLSQNKSQISHLHHKLKSLTPAYTQASKTARDSTKITFSPIDSGSQEYQTTKETSHVTARLKTEIDEIIDGIRFSGQHSAELHQKMQAFINAVGQSRDNEAQKLEKEIIDLARDMYQKNFKNGFDVTPFNWLEVVGVTLLSIAVGASMGYGIDQMVDNHRLRHDLRR